MALTKDFTYDMMPLTENTTWKNRRSFVREMAADFARFQSVQKMKIRFISVEVKDEKKVL